MWEHLKDLGGRALLTHSLTVLFVEINIKLYCMMIPCEKSEKKMSDFFFDF